MKKRLSIIIERLKNLSFYRKKKFYIVLTVLFSLILLVDIAVAIFVPAQTQGFGGMRGNFSQMTEMPEGSESGEMPEMPEGFGSGEMPEGFDPSQMGRPGRSEEEGTAEKSEESEEESSQNDENAENSEAGTMEMPEGFSRNQRSSGGFLQYVKSHWLIIFIIFAILDAASIFMLVRISRKEEKEQVEEIQETVVEQVSPTGKTPKKDKQPHLVGGIFIGGMVLLAVLVKVLTSQSGTEEEQTEATVYSGTAEKGSITSVVPGTGTLTDEEGIELELPEQVELIEWYVENGDSIQEGDKIAQVDTVSAMTAIVEIQEKLENLDEELAEHENDEISDTITATAAGRVKIIYASQDASVVETMYESDALMLLSLDGLMAVSIETKAEISVGEKMTVTLSDDTTVDGKVESYVNGVAVITVSDEDGDYAENVTVATEDGTEIGTGELYIHSELKVTGFTGTIEDVEVSDEEEVSEGEALLTLTDTDYTGKYELLLQQRSELEGQIQTLFKLYQEKYVYASCTGVITGLSDDIEVASSETEETETVENEETTEESQGTVTETSYSSNTAKSTNYQNPAITNMSYSTVKIVPMSTVRQSVTVAPMTTAETTPEVTTTPEPTSTPEVTATPEPTTTPEATTPEPTATPEPTTPEATTTPEPTVTPEEPELDDIKSYTNYIGTVAAVNGSAGDSLKVDINLVTMTPGESAQTKSVTLAASQYAYSFANGSYKAGTAKDIQVNDMLMLVYETGNETGEPVLCIRISTQSTDQSITPDNNTQGIPEDNAQSGFGNAQGDASGMQGNMSGIQSSMSNIAAGFAASGTTNQTAYTEVMETLEEEVEADYSVASTTWMSVIPQETMEITITVDEMDILSLQTGQEALVTLDAFPGQSFEGTVKTINVTGTNSGGSSKYEAVISMERQENMLAGMNASVDISVSEKADILIIPEAALVEQESGVYVYTSYDEETETFGDLVEVTTGVSDGENVEILSGLSEGSEYWYSYLDVVNYTSYFSTGSGGFSIQSMFGGGRGNR